MKYYKVYHKYTVAEVEVYETGITGHQYESHFVSLDEVGRLEIRPGKGWDGASGPTFDTKSSMRGSLIHDVIYEILADPNFKITDRQHTLLRHQADLIFHDILLEDKMWEWRADRWLNGVRAAGGPHAEKKARKVYTAP